MPPILLFKHKRKSPVLASITHIGAYSRPRQHKPWMVGGGGAGESISISTAKNSVSVHDRGGVAILI